MKVLFVVDGHMIKFVKSLDRVWGRKDDVVRYTYDINNAIDVTPDISARLKRDVKTEKLDMHVADRQYFEKKMARHRFWVIGTINKHDEERYYSGMQDKLPLWTEWIEDAEICLDYQCTLDSVDILRKTGKKIFLLPVYMKLENELLTPVMMIVCVRRANQQVSYFKSLEKGLVTTVDYSHKATLLTYADAVAMFNKLRVEDKRYLYAVIPKLEDNVQGAKLKEYMKNVSRSVAMTFKLKNISVG